MSVIADPSARKWWALVAIAASVLVVGLDLTVLNLALPTIATDLHASTSDLQWISDAYSLVLAAAMLPAGMLGDRLGRKKVLLVALVLFGASSAACAYAGSTGELIAARAVLGIGAAAIFPLSLSVIPVLFAPEERQKAIALMASATFISFPIGPIVGGYLLDHFWWGSVFLINVPVVVLALIAVVALLPESRSEQRLRLDAGGVVLSSAGLAGLTYGFIEAGQSGWTDAAALTTMAAGVAVLACFVAWERRLTRRAGSVRPLIELGLFRSAQFTWGTTLATLVSFAMFGIFFAMPQYFQEVQGANAMGSGLRLLPMIGGLVVGMIGSTRLATPRRVSGELRAPLASVKGLVTAGFAIMAAALAFGATTKTGSGTGFAAAWLAAFGLGLGLAMPQTMNAALSALSAERSGSGSALISALRQVGATIGVAVLGTVLVTVYRGHLSLHGLPATAEAAARSSVVAGVGVAHALGSASLLHSARTAFVQGMDTMLWACAGIAVASAILALVFLPRRPDGTTGAPRGGAALAADAASGASGASGESGAERAQLEV
ncbi:MAG TPA: DHA2 family efflux MFS transporter permease subunit [Streptosporangiaceae bacterium]|nr:DHA2 family efflux MFS transporter permease subunit [Streptosporangiaceae bacterium]